MQVDRTIDVHLAFVLDPILYCMRYCDAKHLCLLMEDSTESDKKKEKVSYVIRVNLSPKLPYSLNYFDSICLKVVFRLPSSGPSHKLKIFRLLISVVVDFVRANPLL